MRFILFIIVFVLLLLYVKNKREMFAGKKIIGDVSYKNYTVNDVKINEFLYEKDISPQIMSYTTGESGIGITDKIKTLSLDASKVKKSIPEAIKKIGGQEIVNLEAIVPVLVGIAQKNTKIYNDLALKVENLRVEFLELKKTK
jgi:hypothetical protein